MLNNYPYTDAHELNLDWFLARFKEIDHKVTTLDETVREFTEFVSNYFDNLDVQEEIDKKLDEMVADGTMAAIIQPLFDAYTYDINNQITVLEARMDSFSHLAEGSTTGDAELIDARIGGNGVTYATAGDAIRAQYDINHDMALNNLDIPFYCKQFNNVQSNIIKNNQPNGFDPDTYGQGGAVAAVISRPVGMETNREKVVSMTFNVTNSQIMALPMNVKGEHVSISANIMFSNLNDYEILVYANNVLVATTGNVNVNTYNGTYQTLFEDIDVSAGSVTLRFRAKTNDAGIIYIADLTTIESAKASPIPLPYFDMYDVNNPLYGKTINVLADSMGSLDYATPNFWQLIAAKYGCTINNYALSGTCIAYDSVRDPQFGDCFARRYVNMTNDADIVLIIGGTNDYNCPRGNWTDAVDTTFFGALNILLDGLCDKYPGKLIIFLTMPQQQNEYATNTIDPLATLIAKPATGQMSSQERAVAIKKKCEQKAIYCVDVYNQSGINGADTGKVYYYDSIHPSVLGHLKIAELLEDVLQSLSWDVISRP